MRRIIERFYQNSAVEAIISNQSTLANLSTQEEVVILSAAFLRSNKSMIIVKSNLYEAQILYQNIYALIQEGVLFAVEESLQVESIASSPEIHAQKMDVLNTIIQSDKPTLCITHSAAVIRYLPPIQKMKDYTLNLSLSQRIDINELKTKLVKNGYASVNRVDQPLGFSSRGGVVDVYTLQDDNPIRIEFFDDEIESIRFFDVNTQRTIKEVDSVIIPPATELLITDEDKITIREKAVAKLNKDIVNASAETKEELIANVYQDLELIDIDSKERYLYRYFSYLDNNVCFFDYLPNAQIVLSPSEQIIDYVRRLQEENVSYIQELHQEGKALLSFQVFADFSNTIARNNVYEIGLFDSKKESVQSKILPVHFPELPTNKLVLEIQRLAKENTVLICLKENDFKRVLDIFVQYDVNYQMCLGEIPTELGIYILNQELYSGFESINDKLIVLTAREIFHTNMKTGRFFKKFKEAIALEDYTDLTVGDFIVHSQHGIGKYLGIVTKEFDNIHKDFLNIAYRGDDVLLVPLEQFQLVRKFVGSEAIVPKLSKLGSSEWRKTKEKIQEDVAKTARKLLELYSSREQDIGFAFSKDNEEQALFESMFEYELTADQAQATEEIKKDMESSKPMDRLLCGDVGFGKTEVAIRAAFKAVLDKKQVAYLCPTTILSRQHYVTFLQRLTGFPVNVALVNRFVEPQRIKKILQDVKEGKIDILIGTHRLLSKDVLFKDLGLLIIDEEQRFGVQNKEKIKEMKQSIDVLSLSATPIPRTLQMSLIGVRSLSQLQTAPVNRMPVQTYVIEKNQNVIKEVIQRELARGGQVFYLFNKVSEIYQTARKISKLVPEANIAVAHGQMSREEIEDVMFRFTDNEYNVLICTTIIETGIDIPNANTILIEQADTFGLSQLYQIKGRVGRSDRIAYSYLMYKGNKQLSEIATKRLQSIKDFTSLGSGYKIAMRDLTIRGAGDLLGEKQAGFINTVGMDMYVEMLHDAILAEKGEIVETEKEEIRKYNIGVDGYIPKQYAPQDYEKISLYQRIEKATSEKKLNELEEEIKDRYGKSPKSIQLLFEKRRMELMSNNEKIENIKENSKEVQIVFTKDWCENVDGVRLFEMVSKISIDVKMKYEKEKIVLTINKKTEWLALTNKILEGIKRL